MKAWPTIDGRIVIMLCSSVASRAKTIVIVTMIVISPAQALYAQQKPQLRPLHIALANHSVTLTAIYVAKHLGIFESYGYDARVLVLEPRAAIAAMLAGDLDFYKIGRA